MSNPQAFTFAPDALRIAIPSPTWLTLISLAPLQFERSIESFKDDTPFIAPGLGHDKSFVNRNFAFPVFAVSSTTEYAAQRIGQHGRAS